MSLYLGITVAVLIVVLYFVVNSYRTRVDALAKTTQQQKNEIAAQKKTIANHAEEVARLNRLVNRLEEINAKNQKDRDSIATGDNDTDFNNSLELLRNRSSRARNDNGV